MVTDGEEKPDEPAELADSDSESEADQNAEKDAEESEEDEDPVWEPDWNQSSTSEVVAFVGEQILSNMVAEQTSPRLAKRAICREPLFIRKNTSI